MFAHTGFTIRMYLLFEVIVEVYMWVRRLGAELAHRRSHHELGRLAASILHGQTIESLGFTQEKGCVLCEAMTRLEGLAWVTDAAKEPKRFEISK